MGFSGWEKLWQALPTTAWASYIHRADPIHSMRPQDLRQLAGGYLIYQVLGEVPSPMKSPPCCAVDCYRNQTRVTSQVSQSKEAWGPKKGKR